MGENLHYPRSPQAHHVVIEAIDNQQQVSQSAYVYEIKELVTHINHALSFIYLVVSFTDFFIGFIHLDFCSIH